MSEAHHLASERPGLHGVEPVQRPIPRVAIEAFCETPELALVLRRAAQDRHLAKAHLGVHMGGIAAAVAAYGERATPGLILAETRLFGADLLHALEQLAAVCDARARVIVIGHTNDIGIYRELIRQGVSDYLVAPLEPATLIESVARLYADPEAPPIGRTVAFAGARGGAGSSTVAHNVAWCISEHLNEDATILDLDLPFGTGGLDFNQDPAQGLADALLAPERVDDVLLDRLTVECTDRLTLLAAPATLDRDYMIEPETYEAVVDAVRRTVPCMILDLPHVWTAWSRKLLVGADEIVVTATPDLASLRNAKNLLDVLAAARPGDAPAHLVINQVGVAGRPEIPVRDFAETVGREPALILPFDPALFGAAANNGQMLGQIDGSARAATGLRHLAAVVSGRGAALQPARPASLLRRFLGRKG